MDLAELAVPGLHEWLFERVVKLPGITPSASVLDLGCGAGAWLARLYRAGVRNLWGADRRSEFGAANIAKFVQADLDRGFHVEGQFDLVTAIEVVEHLRNPDNLFRIAAAHLTNGGWFVLTTPNIFSLRARLRFFIKGDLISFNRTGDPTHLHPLIPYTFEHAIIRESGLILRKMATYPEHSHGAGRLATLAVRTLSFVLSDELPGENLCLFMQRDHGV
jgi:SAM-dependent methyltransferase